MTQKVSRFQQYARNKVLELLELEPLTISELATKSKIKYDSVRNAVLALQDYGEVKAMPGQYRNVKFMLGNETGATNAMSRVTNNADQIKLITLLQLRKTKRISTIDAIENLPRHVARILFAAKTLNEREGAEVNRNLEHVQKEMEFDRARIANTLAIYDQILADDRIWNPKILRRFPSDSAWSDAEVSNAYHHYFSAEDD